MCSQLNGLVHQLISWGPVCILCLFEIGVYNGMIRFKDKLQELLNDLKGLEMTLSFQTARSQVSMCSLTTLELQLPYQSHKVYTTCISPCIQTGCHLRCTKCHTKKKVGLFLAIQMTRYPLVNVSITMENHHDLWLVITVNQLFRLGHVQVRKV
jgi:hypothetical protein